MLQIGDETSRCDRQKVPLCGDKKYFLSKLLLSFPIGKIQTQNNFSVLQVPVDIRCGEPRRKLPCTAQAIGRNKDKILEKTGKETIATSVRSKRQTITKNRFKNW